ncbi:FtsX-like permease family protein [Candidatus Falkowbacteria bacterium]|nr:FtsX-like permease family protein [Candidatus Falkowbacteria bacterium]
MPIIAFFRAIKFSIQDIARNFWLSLVTIIILVLALSLVNILLTVQVVTQSAINSLKEKIDVTLDLKAQAQEGEILALKSQVSNLDKVRSVEYISKGQAIETFRKEHENDPDILQALRELNTNPLTASLIIKPKDIDQYDALITDLNKIDSPIIDSRNFDNPKTMLDKINVVTDKINQIGVAVSLLFVLITILVVYNSIRVTIYTHQKEIRVMRLVGASNWFIRAPFLISSIVYTAIGLLLTLLLFYPLLNLMQPYLEYFFNGYKLNLITYFQANFIMIFGTQFVVASLVNLLASFIAVRKYSRI